MALIHDKCQHRTVKSIVRQGFRNRKREERYYVGRPISRAIVHYAKIHRTTMLAYDYSPSLILLQI